MEMIDGTEVTGHGTVSEDWHTPACIHASTVLLQVMAGRVVNEMAQLVETPGDHVGAAVRDRNVKVDF